MHTETLPEGINIIVPLFLGDSLRKIYLSIKLDSAYMIADTTLDAMQRRIVINDY